MQKQEDKCQVCGNKLATRENDASVLLVCVNQNCENYWVRKGSEIIMMLK